MRERRGTVSRLTGLAEGVAAAARRRQRDRSPRVLLYDQGGHPRTLSPADRSFEEVVGAAARMIALTGGGDGGVEQEEDPPAASSTGGVSVPSSRTEREKE